MSAGSAKGLFRAMGKERAPRVVDLIDGEGVISNEVAREKDDFYATKPEAIDSFIATEGARLRALGLRVWEPAAGDGAIVRPLREFGLDVFASDLVDRGCGAKIGSFYDFHAGLPSWAIVTNPPFQETNWRDAKGRWLYHALATLKVPYMALLLPLSAFAAGGWAEFWENHAPARVYLMRWKIDFTGEGSPPTNHCWYVWDGHAAPEDTRLLMMDRKDWRQGGLFDGGGA
jgi:hypothetical protein